VRKSRAGGTTFGPPGAKTSRTRGLFKWPWPIQNVYKFDQRIQNSRINSPTLTADNNMSSSSVMSALENLTIASVLSRIPRRLGYCGARMLEKIVRSAKAP